MALTEDRAIMSTPSRAPAAPAVPPREAARRHLLLVVMAAAAIAAGFLLRDHLSFAGLEAHREAILAFRDRHTALSASAFVAAYVAITVLALPGALVVTMAGGFVFGFAHGLVLNLAGATTGAVILFLAVRWGIGAETLDRLRHAQSPMGARLRHLIEAMQRNEWSVLFLMRLIPVVPFFVANLVPAFLGVPLRRFLISTCLGILPAALVYTSAGVGLGEVFDAGGRPDAGLIFRPAILGPLLGLAALAALPLVLRSWRRGRA